MPNRPNYIPERAWEHIPEEAQKRIQPNYGDVEWPSLDVKEDNPTIESTQPNAAATTPSGIPEQVTNVSATESPSKQQDRVYSLVSVSFTRGSSDLFFAGARIWLVGYKGNMNAILVADAQDSPVSFLVETTNETVVVKVQAFGTDGTPASYDDCPSTTVLLDGVASAPPDPTIAQYIVAISGGWQFQFNFLTGLIEEVIDGYWIYRSATNDVATAIKYKYVKHPPTNTGIYTFQDIVASTQYYWVSAIALNGMESAKVSAYSAGGPGGGGTISERPTTYTKTGSANYTNPTYAYDENQTSYARGYDSTGYDKGTKWHGFSAASGSPTLIKLKVLSLVGIYPPAEGESYLKYSLDGGSTWITIYDVTSTRSMWTDIITLSNSQDLMLVQVKAASVFNSDWGYTESHINDIWIEVTT
jgi:hypothetical protein